MGMFQDSLKKWFYTNNSQAASSDARIPLLTASGAPKGSDTMANLASVISNVSFTGGVGVAVCESDYLRFRQPDQAASYKNIAVGVWVNVGGKLIVVAKDQVASTKWATSNVSGGTTAKGREAAIADMDGRTNTSTIITTLGDNAPAAKYCQGYYPSNVESSNAFVGAGRWWLPSAGELWMIWSHLIEINRIMTIIEGTPLNRSQWYWSSTEGSAASAWGLTFGNGYFNGNYKTNEYSVRPVSAFDRIHFMCLRIIELTMIMGVNSSLIIGISNELW